jgi:hypothetical protein
MVDLDNNGTLDFAEFLALMHVWLKQGGALFHYFWYIYLCIYVERDFLLVCERG